MKSFSEDNWARDLGSTAACVSIAFFPCESRHEGSAGTGCSYASGAVATRFFQSWSRMAPDQTCQLVLKLEDGWPESISSGGKFS